MKLGWIDFSQGDKEKVLDVLNLLSEPGVLDELGIAPIRDGFSDLFFPGTSTIQTRAKYFLIVPYALRDLELKYDLEQINLKTLDDIERESAYKLYANNPEKGIIGSDSIPDGWVQRPPSSIYLAGLRRYKIFNYDKLFKTTHTQPSRFEGIIYQYQDFIIWYQHILLMRIRKLNSNFHIF